MQEELAGMREENTTRYNAVMDSVNLEEVRKTCLLYTSINKGVVSIVGWDFGNLAP